MSLTVHLALVFHVVIAVAVMVVVCGRHGTYMPADLYAGVRYKVTSRQTHQRARQSNDRR